MNVNTFIDFHLNSTGTAIEKIFYCTNTGRKEITKFDIIEYIRGSIRGHYNLPFDFTFYNLCQNFPGRILIYSETYSSYCEREWWSYAHLTLMSAYSRIHNLILLPGAARKVDVISYTPIYYADSIHKVSMGNGLELLYFNKSELFSSCYQGENNPISTYPDFLLFYPITFELKGDFYCAYNPAGGFLPTDISTSDIILFIGESREQSTYSNFTITTGGKIPRFPMYKITPRYADKNHTVYKKNCYPLLNIDMDKLNIGREMLYA